MLMTSHPTCSNVMTNLWLNFHLAKVFIMRSFAIQRV
jgi:hypothetical protein